MFEIIDKFNNKVRQEPRIPEVIIHKGFPIYPRDYHREGFTMIGCILHSDGSAEFCLKKIEKER